MHRLGVSTIAATAVLALTACTSPAEPATSTPAPTSTSSARPEADEPSPAPTDAIDIDTGETIAPEVVPTWDAASRSTAVDAATAAMTAFARPDLDYDTWWAALAPLLTQKAAQDYTYVDPANIPARQVTAGAQLVDDTSAYVAVVSVPTDAGTYSLTLARTDGAAPWLVTRISPPENVG